MFKLVIEANGKKLEKEMKDYATAMTEAQRITKFPYSAEAMIYRGNLMIVWINHAPPSKSKNEEEME